MSNSYELRAPEINAIQGDSVALISIPPPVQYQGGDGAANGALPRSYHQPDAIVSKTSVHKFCPPRGKVGEYLTRCLACLFVWAAIFCVIGQNALPGNNIFSIYVLLVAASFGGFLAGWKTRYFHFPPLLGMLIVGFMLRNIEYINIAKDIDTKWSSVLRNTALVIILLRSGLGLDLKALKRLKFTVLRLAFMPCVLEAATVAIASHVLLKLQWLWAIQLGFIVGAVSPAVVVPTMLNLQLDGYGVSQGIPTMVMAASSCDDVLAISMFGVFLGISFSEGNIYWNIFRAPLELAMGVVGGLLLGCLVWYFPWKKAGNATANRCVLLLSVAIIFLFGSNQINFPGAGALGVLCLGATASYGWGTEDKEPVEKVMGILWEIFQPLLFGLIGAEVHFKYLEPALVGKGIGVLFCGLVLRLIITYVAVSGNNFMHKEKLFIAIAWLPKATVQAAIGSIPLDTARRHNFPGQTEEYGIQIVTIAVLVILITAPIGSIGMSLTGPRWLQKGRDDEQQNVEID